jgi:hypothetical protein
LIPQWGIVKLMYPGLDFIKLHGIANHVNGLTDDDAPRHEHGYEQPQQQPTGRQGRPDGSIQDTMIVLNVGRCAEPHHPENGSNGSSSRGEDGSRGENFDMLPNGFRKHRGKDCDDTDTHSRQREHRHPFVVAECCAFTVYRVELKSQKWTKSS